ncbi:MAG: tyrosine-type recombinase/integrase [Anaerolineales bacterium]|nr:tyrosine-type recombinase/integrase [Anaerolineales bacterium]
MYKTNNSPNHPLSIVNLKLDTAERLPCLVEQETWLPLRLVTRWTVRYRRYHVQSSTLQRNLHSLKKLYEWAWSEANIDLDEFLLQGQMLNARQLESLAACLRVSQANPAEVVSANHYNDHLSVCENFLKWVLDAQNRGGSANDTVEELAHKRERLAYLFRSLRTRHTPSRRIELLTLAEIQAIRAAISPQKDAAGKWQFPATGFSIQTAMRNWLMCETALELGLRRGELLKLRLDSLPRGAQDGIKVMRFPDDPHDSRTVEPGVKTSERVIPASRNLRSALRVYITSPPPQGRVKGKSPYLFVTRSGEPVSLMLADKIIQAIGRYSNVKPLSWHRLRHTWAESMAERLNQQPNGMDNLLYLGGWTARNSVRPYIQSTVARQAQEAMRAYQDSLYAEAMEGGAS